MSILRQQRAKDCQGPRIVLVRFAQENLLAVMGGLVGFVINYSWSNGARSEASKWRDSAETRT